MVPRSVFSNSDFILYQTIGSVSLFNLLIAQSCHLHKHEESQQLKTISSTLSAFDKLSKKMSYHSLSPSPIFTGNTLVAEGLPCADLGPHTVAASALAVHEPDLVPPEQPVVVAALFAETQRSESSIC